MAIEKLTYEYLPKQGRFLSSVNTIPFVAYIGGFGSGKTHVLNLQALREAQTLGRGLIGAPTYKMLEDTTRQKFFDLCPPSWIRSFHSQRNRVILINGTEILFRSLDQPGRLAGLDLHWMGLDEIGEVKESVFKMLIGRLRHQRRRLFGVGNPAGPVHWTYKYFVNKAQKHPDKFRLVQASSKDNTFLPEFYVEDMAISFGEDTAYYKRYVLGEFVAFEGAYWPDYDPRPYPAGHVVDDVHLKQILNPAVNWRWGRTIDFGFENPFVCLWWVHDNTTLVIVDEHYKQHATILEHVLSIRLKEEELQHRFGPLTLGISWTDHDSQCRAEIAACRDSTGELIGFDCSPANKSVLESILLVQALFKRRKLFISNKCEHTLLEVPSYHSKPDTPLEKPFKEDDHTCDAIRYVCDMEMRDSIEFFRCKDAGYMLVSEQSTLEAINEEILRQPSLSVH